MYFYTCVKNLGLRRGQGMFIHSHRVKTRKDGTGASQFTLLVVLRRKQSYPAGQDKKKTCQAKKRVKEKIARLGTGFFSSSSHF